MTSPNTKPPKPDTTPNQRFKVVPPSQLQPQQSAPLAAPPPSETKIKPSQATKSNSFPTGWLIFAGIVVTLGTISQIRVAPSVRAEAWLEPDPNARKVVYMDAPGQIAQVLVIPNQPIIENQPLVLLESQQLEDEIDQSQIAVEETNIATATAHQQVYTAQMRLVQAQQQVGHTQQRVKALQAEIAQMEAGQPPLHILGYESKIANLEAAIASLDDTITNLQPLAAEGAIAKERLNETQRQKMTLQGQVGEIQAAMAMNQRRMYDELEAKQDELNRLQTSLFVAQQDYESAQTIFQSRQPLNKKVQERVEKRLIRYKKNTVLRSPLDGVVVTQNLYLLEGKTLPEGEAILEIADTSKLVAVIEVRQEDRDLIQAGAIVKFNPPEPGLASFRTQIKEIISVLEKDEQLQKSTVNVIATIDSTDKNLQPGAKVYARIESPQKIPLYEQVRRELLNLFKVRKYS
jgi:multidrug resistance efflux pump